MYPGVFHQDFIFTAWLEWPRLSCSTVSFFVEGLISLFSQGFTWPVRSFLSVLSDTCATPCNPYSTVSALLLPAVLYQLIASFLVFLFQHAAKVINTGISTTNLESWAPAVSRQDSASAAWCFTTDLWTTQNTARVNGSGTNPIFQVCQ